MSRKVFITLPTRNVAEARAFYTALGFPENPQFSGEMGVALDISDTIQLMLLDHSTFCKFSPRAICDTSKCLQVLHSLTCGSRVEVDDLVRKAVAAGGSVVEPAQVHKLMYQHSFLDRDGHGWNMIHMPDAP